MQESPLLLQCNSMSELAGETTSCSSDQVQVADQPVGHCSNHQYHTSAHQQQTRTHTHTSNAASRVVSPCEETATTTGQLAVSSGEDCQCLRAGQDKKAMTVDTNTTMPDLGSPHEHVDSVAREKREKCDNVELSNQDSHRDSLQVKPTMESTADTSRDLHSTIPSTDEQQACFASSTPKEQQSPSSPRRNPSGKRGAKKQRPPKRIRDRMKRNDSTPIPGVTELVNDDQQRTEDIEGKQDIHRSIVEQVPSPLRVQLPSPQDTYHRQLIDHHYSPSEPSLRKLVKDLHRCDISIMRYQQILLQQCNQAMCNVQRVFAMLRIGLNAREEDIMRELQSLRQTASLILQRRKATAICLRKLSENATRLEEPQVLELKHQLKQFVTDRKVDEEIGTTRCFYADPDDLLPQIMGFGRVSTIQPSYISWNENPWDAVEKSAIKVQLRQDECTPPANSPTPAQSSQQINSFPCQDQLIASQSQPQQHHQPATTTTPSSATKDNTSNISISRENEKSSSVLETVSDSAENETFDAANTQERSDTLNQDEKQTGSTELSEKEDSEELMLKDKCSQIPEPDSRLKDSDEATEDNTCENNSDTERGIDVKEQDEQATEYERNAEEEEELVESNSQQPSLEIENDEEDDEKESSTDDADTVDLTSPPPTEDHQNTSQVSDVSSSLSAIQNISLPQQQLARTDNVVKEEEDEAVKEQMEANMLCVPREEYEEGEFGRRRKYSPEQLAVIQERVRESLQQQGVFLYDPFTGKVNKPTSSTGSGQETDDHTRKKKTPTQLRRERKKRQRERERKQRETERLKQHSVGRRFRGDSLRTPMNTFDDSGIGTSGSSSSQEEMSPRIRKGSSEIKTIVHIVRPALQRYRHCKPILLERPHPTRDRVNVTSTRGAREKSSFRV